MDPQTINVLAATAVGFLAPYFAQAGETAAKKIGEDLYQAIKNRFGKKESAMEAVEDLKRKPEDPDRQAALRVRLQKLLEEDETFAVEMRRLLQEAEKTEAGTTVIKQVAGNNARQFGQVFGNVTFGKS